MKAERDIAKRMREMLTQDKLGIKEGFSSALMNDVNKLLGDYFELDAPVEVEVELKENGKYALNITAVADRVKQFETTFDIKRY